MALLRQCGLAVTAFLLATHTAFAADGSFVVKNIRITGLEGLSPQTVLSYMPVKIGQTLNPGDTSNIIAALYETGFFSNVSLAQSGNTLIVNVAERDVIGDIKVSGNSLIDSDQINNVLKQTGLIKGQALNHSTLDSVVKSLKSAYDLQGHYNAIITTTITPISHHRANVHIQISEGRVALVQNIHIIGNHAFTEKELINTFTLTTGKWNSFYTRADHYSKDAFHDSLEKLANYYFDRGYLHFRIDSANAVLSPDRKSVSLIVHITEGAQYRLSGYQLTGLLLLSPQTYQKLPAVKALKTGEIFSRQKIVDASNSMQNALGDQGYAFAEANVTPQIDENRKTVTVVFQIIPNRRIYVHQIYFKGNTSTADQVLRSQMQQAEAELYSTKLLNQSELKLNQLGFFNNIKETTTPVSGKNNQVDLNYAVSEQPSAAATVGAGYGTDGFVVNAGVNEMNFMGTGDQVGINFANSPYQRSYSLNYNNPNYTPDGVQRGFTLFNTRTLPGNLNIAPYEFTQYGGNVIYSIPFSFSDSYQVGIGLQRTRLTPDFNPSAQIVAFVKHEGQTFNQTMLTLGWTRNKLNLAFLPTEGTYQNASLQVSAPLAGPKLDYYKLSYQFRGYFPISHGFIGSLIGSMGYGGGYGSTQGLPFFANYYAGGLTPQGQVRGYSTNTLGPLDSQGNPVGGNTLIAGSAELILPHPLSGDTFRTRAFVDAGNVFTTWDVYNTYRPNSVIPNPTGIHLGDLRYSTGVDVQFRLPVLNAVIEFSLAKALNPKRYDQTQIFNFNIGTTF
jgi:outer membrane protein insertion porin family